MEYFQAIIHITEIKPRVKIDIIEEKFIQLHPYEYNYFDKTEIEEYGIDYFLNDFINFNDYNIKLYKFYIVSGIVKPDFITDTSWGSDFSDYEIEFMVDSINFIEIKSQHLLKYINKIIGN